MPHNVQIELAANRIAKVDLGREDRLLIVYRARDDLAQRIHDAAAAARDDRGGRVRDTTWIIGRIVASPRELIAAQDKAAPLERDVTHAREPAIATVGSGREVHLNA